MEDLVRPVVTKKDRVFSNTDWYWCGPKLKGKWFTTPGLTETKNPKLWMFESYPC